MILADSSVWIDYFNGHQSQQTDTLDRLLTENLLIIGDLIFAEVLQGFRRDVDFYSAKRALQLVPCYDMLGKEQALKCADNYRRLRSNGITIRKTIDMIIATFCIEHQLPLLHNDKDFDKISEVLPLVIV